MDCDHPTRFHGDTTQPELATLHPIKLRTQVNGFKQLDLDPLILGWWSLLSAHRPQSHDKAPPCKQGHQDNESFRVHAGPPFHLCRDMDVLGNSNALLPMTIVAGVPPFHSGGTYVPND